MRVTIAVVVASVHVNVQEAPTDDTMALRDTTEFVAVEFTTSVAITDRDSPGFPTSVIATTVVPVLASSMMKVPVVLNVKTLLTA